MSWARFHHEIMDVSEFGYFPGNFVFELGYKRSYKRFEAQNVENYRFSISMSQILKLILGFWSEVS